MKSASLGLRHEFAGATGVISTDASRATVRVIRTDEELMIARSVGRILAIEPVKERN